MPSNPMENDMLLMNEAFREAMGDISHVDHPEDIIDIIVDGTSALEGKYVSTRSSGGSVKGLTVVLSVRDSRTAKNALFLTDAQCDVVSLGDDIQLEGGIIEDVSVNKNGTQFLVTVEIVNYPEAS